MIEDILLQYGAIGACLVFFMGAVVYLLKYLFGQFAIVVNNNTVALTQFSERVQHCPNVKRKI